METVTDGEGNKTTYVYDSHDRLEKTYYPTPNPKGAVTSNSADYERPAAIFTAPGPTSR